MPDRIRLIDADRLLMVDHLIPLANIRQVVVFTSDFTSFIDRSVAVSIYYANSDTKEYTAGLYLYDYSIGTLTTIFTAAADEPFIQLNTGEFSFFPIPSHQTYQFAFFNPLNQQLSRFDFDKDTHQITTLTDPGLFQQPTATDRILWSPDDTQIAAKTGQTLYILNADGSDQREYPFESRDFNILWSDDSRYIQILRQIGVVQTENRPIEILDVSDGSNHPFTKDLEGIDPEWWGCENQWLTYTVATENQRDGYILDLNTGDQIRVNDHPLLAEKSVEFISLLTNCQQFVVSGYISNAQTSGVMTPSIYLFDIADQTVEFLDNTSRVLQLGEEDEIHYQKRDDTNIQIFKRTINPLSEPVLVREFPALKTSSVSWSSDFSFFIYHRYNLGAGMLHLFNNQTGRTYTLTSPDELVQAIAFEKWRETEEAS